MLDNIIVFSFLSVTLALGVYSGRHIKTLKEFSVSHQNYSQLVLVATIFATVIGGGSTFGIVEKVSNVGFGFFFVFLGMAFNRILTAKFIAPHLNKFSDCNSISEIMGKLYGQSAQRLTGICVLLVSIASVGTQTFTIGFILHQLTGISHEFGMVLGCGILIIYSAAGGMRSVVATDVLQFVFLLVLIPFLLSLGTNIDGGFQSALTHLTHDETLLKFNSSLLSVFILFLLGSADPSFLQRLLVAKNRQKAKKSILITGYISILFYLIMSIIGLIAIELLPETPGNPLINLVNQYFPAGLRGIILCGLLSAVMSSADSDLNMVGITFSNDFLKQTYSEKFKLLAAKWSTAILGSLAVLVAIKANNILDIIVFAFSFWAPSVLIPLVAGMLGYPVNQKQMFAGVILGAFTTVMWDLFSKYYVSFTLDGAVLGIFLHTFFYIICVVKNNDFKRILSRVS